MQISLPAGFFLQNGPFLFVASQFSMQSGEVYKLHSFLLEVYSFWRRRSYSPKSYDKICTFCAGIAPIYIFLFDWAFAIIIVYNERCAEAPFYAMFST